MKPKPTPTQLLIKHAEKVAKTLADFEAAFQSQFPTGTPVDFVLRDGGIYDFKRFSGWVSKHQYMAEQNLREPKIMIEMDEVPTGMTAGKCECCQRRWVHVSLNNVVGAELSLDTMKEQIARLERKMAESQQ